MNLLSTRQHGNEGLVSRLADEPGRLAHEFAQDPKEVILRVNDALNRAALVMGIHPDAKTLAITATEAVKKILEVYPHAPVEDLATAIRMASFGELRVENQLTTISAYNVYGWYKQFREDKSHLTAMPPAAAINIMNPEPSQSEKLQIVRRAFVNFVTDPQFNDLSLDFQFNKLVDIGAFNPSAEDKRKYYFAEAFKATQAPPIEFLKDRDKRRDVLSYQDLYKSEGENIKFAEVTENALHRFIIDRAKRTMLMDFMKSTSSEHLIQLFDAKYGQELD